jgi:hypothetical protein
MAAEGTTDPIHAVRNLMQTAAVLRLGTPVQKADLVARLINVYGVDIKTLDTMLSNPSDPQIQQQTEVQKLLQQELAPFKEFMNQQQMGRQTQQQQVQRQAQEAVEKFAQQAEFLDDPEIANTMADLLEVAAKRNRTLSMQDAYDQAVQLHPEISKVVAQRKAAAASNDIAVARAKEASSSVKGSPMSGAPPDAGDGSIRSDLLRAMDRI